MCEFKQFRLTQAVVSSYLLVVIKSSLLTQHVDFIDYFQTSVCVASKLQKIFSCFPDHLLPSRTPADITSSDPSSVSSSAKRGTPGVGQTPYTPSMRIPHTPKVCNSENFVPVIAANGVFEFTLLPRVHVLWGCSKKNFFQTLPINVANRRVGGRNPTYKI